jgi:hypothetical protein
MTVITKPKFFKNPQRQLPQEPYKPYTPQYQVKGIEPEYVDMGSTEHAPQQISVLRTQNKPQPASTIVPKNVPYAEMPAMTPASRMVLPNVGNNVEQAWHGALVSEEELAENELIDIESLQMESKVMPPPNFDSIHQPDELKLEIAVGDYLLMINAEVVAMGSQQDIEKIVEAIVFEGYGGIPQTDIDKLVVLQRKKIKAGVFVE